MSNGNYFIIISSKNTNAEIVYDFLNDLDKYIKSKPYYKGAKGIILIDYAAYHRLKRVMETLKDITLNVLFLRAYTPQFQSIKLFSEQQKQNLENLPRFSSKFDK